MTIKSEEPAKKRNTFKAHLFVLEKGDSKYSTSRRTYVRLLSASRVLIWSLKLTNNSLFSVDLPLL